MKTLSGAEAYKVVAVVGDIHLMNSVRSWVFSNCAYHTDISEMTAHYDSKNNKVVKRRLIHFTDDRDLMLFTLAFPERIFVTMWPSHLCWATFKET